MAFAERAGYEVIGTYKETASGVRLDRAERREVLALAQRRGIDAVLVAELSRWGCSYRLVGRLGPGCQPHAGGDRLLRKR